MKNKVGKVIKALEKATNGTYEIDSCTSTLMGWVKKYDGEGRLLTCDPNFKDFKFEYNGKIYNITKVGWKVYVWKGNQTYMSCFSDYAEQNCKEFLDFTPDYVIEYYKHRKIRKN